MESNFKVILRDYFGSESSFLKWEEGCPVIPVAVQVSRNRETSEEHLQLRFRNISAKAVEEFAWEAVVTYADGTTEEIGDRYLDADIAPGGVYGIKPIVLAGVKTSGVEVRILDAESEDDRWDSENCPVSLLPRIELGWGEELLSGRRSLLLQKGVGKERAETRWFCPCGGSGMGLGRCRFCGKRSPLEAIPVDGKVQEKDRFWICACGQPNVDRDKCWSCGCSKELLLDTESADDVQAFIDDRAKREQAQATRKKKTIIISSVSVTLVVVLVSVALAVNFLSEKGRAYAQAQEYIAQSDYFNAEYVLRDLDWRDSDELRRMCKYHLGLDYMEKGLYESALKNFQEAGDYEDAPAFVAQMEEKINEREAGEEETPEEQDQTALSDTSSDEDASADSGKGQGGSGSSVLEPQHSTNATLETPYYAVDLVRCFTSASPVEDYSYTYKDSFSSGGWESGGAGYWTTVFSPSGSAVFEVACFQPPAKPEGDYATRKVGSVTTPNEGTLTVYLMVPIDRDGPNGDVAGKNAADEANVYLTAVELNESYAEDGSGYILPESDSRKYSKSELAGLSNWELYVARNEIFARHGRGFKNEDLVTYFNAKSWYSELMAPEDFDEVFSPNKYEKANTDLIMELERDGNSPYLN